MDSIGNRASFSREICSSCSFISIRARLDVYVNRCCCDLLCGRSGGISNYSALRKSSALTGMSLKEIMHSTLLVAFASAALTVSFVVPLSRVCSVKVSQPRESRQRFAPQPRIKHGIQSFEQFPAIARSAVEVHGCKQNSQSLVAFHRRELRNGED